MSITLPDGKQSPDLDRIAKYWDDVFGALAAPKTEIDPDTFDPKEEWADES